MQSSNFQATKCNFSSVLTSPSSHFPVLEFLLLQKWWKMKIIEGKPRLHLLLLCYLPPSLFLLLLLLLLTIATSVTKFPSADAIVIKVLFCFVLFCFCLVYVKILENGVVVFGGGRGKVLIFRTLNEKVVEGLLRFRLTEKWAIVFFCAFLFLFCFEVFCFC